MSSEMASFERFETILFKWRFTMNTSIKNITLSGMMLVIASQACGMEDTFVNMSQEVGQVTTSTVETVGRLELIRNYMSSGLATTGTALTGAGSYVRGGISKGASTVGSYVAPVATKVATYVPSKETMMSYVPTKDAVLSYVPSKESVTTFVTTLPQYATLKNGGIAVAGVAAVAGALYAYKNSAQLVNSTKVVVDEVTSSVSQFRMSADKSEAKDLLAQITSAKKLSEKNAVRSLTQVSSDQILKQLINKYFTDRTEANLNAIKTHLGVN